MKTLSTSLFILLLFACSAFAQRVAEGDLEVLEGAGWTGTLTYLDYSTNKKTSIKSNVSINRKPGVPSTWVFAYVYPDEPKANGTSNVVLSPDGKLFNEQKVVEVSKLPGRTLRIVATKAGEDNDKKALFRYTYTFNATVFTVRKDVQYNGETEWFERNTYSWAR